MNNSYDDNLEAALDKAFDEIYPKMDQFDKIFHEKIFPDALKFVHLNPENENFRSDLYYTLLELLHNLAREQNTIKIPDQSRSEARKAQHRLLENLAKSTKNTLDVLEEIMRHRFHPTSQALMEAAATEQFDQKDSTLFASLLHGSPAENQGRPTAPCGYRRLKIARDALSALHNWAGSAEQKMKPSGRPPEDAARYAILKLAELWERQTGSWPTYGGAGGIKDGPFVHFVRAMLNPIRELFCLKAGMFTGIIGELPSRKAKNESTR